MKATYVIASLLLLVACTTKQAEIRSVQPPTPVTIKANKPETANVTSWRDEKMPFPPEFAPNLHYRGDLIVNFSPLWRQFDAPEGFSYVFHWLIEPGDFSDGAIEQTLVDYFDGLMTVVGEARPIAVQDNSTPTRVIFSKNQKTFHGTGTVATWNAFNRGEALKLNIETVEQKCADGRTQISFALSKLSRDAEIWHELRAVRDKLNC